MMKRKKILVAIVLFAAICGAAAYIYLESNKEEAVNSQEVFCGTIADTIEETGTVFSKAVSTFYSDASRRVETLNVAVGDRVTAGDVILTYNNNVDLEIEAAKKQVDALTAQYNESVKGADFREIANAKLNVETYENSLNMARDNLEKMKVLLDNGAVSKVDYDKAEKEVQDLENSLQGAENSYLLISQGVSSNVRKQYESQIDEVLVRIRLLEKSKEDNVIIANFDGVVTELNVTAGGMTQAGGAVVEIQDDRDLSVYVRLLAEDAVKVAEGMKVSISSDNMKAESFSVSRIYPKAESQMSDLGVEQKRIRVEADLPDGEVRFKIGVEAPVKIILAEVTDAVLVNRDAIYKSEGKEYVDVLTDGNRVQRLIVTGIKDEENAQVVSGLEVGEMVVLK